MIYTLYARITDANEIKFCNLRFWLHESFFIDFRVKEAIAKKDKQSEELVKQRDAAVRRADYAEQLLIEQGKKLLGKN